MYPHVKAAFIDDDQFHGWGQQLTRIPCRKINKTGEPGSSSSRR
jgi:hypothetical protein